MLARLSHQVRSFLRRQVCPFEVVYTAISPGSRVFDLGCGTGALLSEIIRLRSPTLIGGSELDASLLEHARAATLEALALADSNIPVVFEISEQPPDAISGFDCVTLIDVLHHIPIHRQGAYLDRVGMVLQSGALFVLKDIDSGNPLVIFNKLHDAIFGANGGNEISVKEAESLLEHAGLTVKLVAKVRRLWYPHYLIVAEKP